jgi:hypothetical protein
VVAILTTAGAARFAAGLILPGMTVPGALEAASNKVTPCKEGRRFNHSGFKVTSTNHTANKTVTTCEKSNQYRFIKICLWATPLYENKRN